MSHPVIGHCDFVDGTSRPVYRDEQGQYVKGANDEPVYGWWLRPTEEEWAQLPVVARARERHGIEG
jgi:hypothetical protein